MLQIIFDVETKNTLDEVGGYFPEKLDISYIGACIRDGSLGEGKMQGFFEHEFDQFFELMAKADVLVGFNSEGFDLPALSRIYKGDIKEIPSLDLMARIKKSCGHRIGLDTVASATFNLGKSGSGLDAIKYYKEGRLKELADYCLQDVAITRQLFDYGLQNGHVKFKNKWNRMIECPVDFVFVPPKTSGKQAGLF